MGDVSEDEMKAMNDRMAAVTDLEVTHEVFEWKTVF